MFDEIINQKDKEIQRKLLFKYIDSTNFDTFLYYLNNNNSSLYPFFEMVKDNLIDVYVDKEPLIFDISDDDIINITGESGSGKSTYVKKYFNNEDYKIVETDILFGKDTPKDDFVNHLRDIIFTKYIEEFIEGQSNLPINFRHFNDVFEIILNESKNIDKTLVIDSGQFRHLKRFDLLKGKMIFIRTSVKESIRRACDRFDIRYPDATEKEKEDHMVRKYTAYELYKKINTVIIKCFILYRF